MRRFWMTAVAVVAGTTLLATACSKTEPRGGGVDGAVPIAALTSFDACDEHLSWIQEAALERVGPYGLGGGYVAFEGDIAFDAAAEAPVARSQTEASASADFDGSGAAGSDDTGTNNQEAGVDEADQVKTDGRQIVAVRDNRLIVVDAATSEITGTLELDIWNGQLFLVGDTAFVFGQKDIESTEFSRQAQGGADLSYPGAYAQATEILEVDLTDGAQITDRMTVEGSVSAGRLIDDTVRLVVTHHQPVALGFVQPNGPRAEERAKEMNRDIIQESEIADWVPAAIGSDGDRTPLVECTAMYHPAEFAGFGTTAVLSFTGLDDVSTTGVAADGGTTYASSTGLYVATTDYVDYDEVGQVIGNPRVATDIHRFDIATRGRAVYQGSGSVDGTVINQYAMSEHDSALRIATTKEGSSGGSCPRGADCTQGSEAVSSSQVAVLELQGDELVEVGKVVGLGPTERIQSVRFMGDRGYVVTFRQTDPLYALDLSDPTSPEVLGELKIEGFSQYMHPVADGLLLGVGVDANADGRQQGAKLALFDVTDPTSPDEVDRITFQSGWFNVGNDPHAFTWDADRNQAVITGTWYEGGDMRQGAIVVGIDNGQLVDRGRIVHDPNIDHATVALGAPEATTTSTTTTTEPPTTTTEPSTTVPGGSTSTVVTTTEPASTTTASGSSTGSEGGAVSEDEEPILVEPTQPIPEPFPFEPDFADTTVPIERTFLVGDHLWAMSGMAFSAHDRDSLAELTWVWIT
jgi:uncharacterized secreted protein with C-terminal beta-propeller domain